MDKLLEHSWVLRIGRLQVRVNWYLALCVVMTCTVFINLGFWQLDRAAEKRQLQRDMLEQQQAVPVLLESIADDQIGPALTNRRVRLLGEYLNDATFLVVFQFLQGQPGFEVLSPFRLSSDGSLVLVSRGWIAPGEGPGGIPDIPALPGPQELIAQVFIPEQTPEAGPVEDSTWPIRLRRLNIAQASRLLGEALRPMTVRLEPAQAGVLARHWPAVTVSTRNNIGYAIQWFSFTGVVLLLSLLLSSNLLQLLRERRQ
ncbi:MAG: SURF1 family protein [Pseudomonadales bacterium]|nr:SURF1 family protein [Pseudomonadales bacterium]